MFEIFFVRPRFGIPVIAYPRQQRLGKRFISCLARNAAKFI
jgi:hypothetical protein